MKNIKILSSVWFITALLILVLNDFIFKELYGNYLTGKLSDFAGLFIFPLFWTALFPDHKNRIFWLTAVLFIYWKSPYSQGLIEGLNTLGIISIGRVVDLTDLIALIVLLPAFKIEKFKLPVIKLNPVIPLVVSSFAFIATQLKEPDSYESNPMINFRQVYDLNYSSSDSLVSDIEKLGFEVKHFKPKHESERIEIYNLNDTIELTKIYITGFRHTDIPDSVQTEKIQAMVRFGNLRLRDSSILGKVDLHNLDITSRIKLQRIFEREVIEKLNTKMVTNKYRTSYLDK